MTFERIAVVGAGAWGTALAGCAARAGRHVMLVPRDAASAAALARNRESPRLPGFALDPTIAVVGAPDDAVRTEVVLLAVPAQACRAVLATFAEKVAADTVIVSCAKGIERATRRFMTEVIEETVPQARPAILSGPSFAADVARGLPTAVTLAAHDEGVAVALCRALGTARFRPYHSTDVRGVEIGGAAKNVLAIAAGIVAGRRLGASAAAALTTRGFAELIRFGHAYGARAETLTGLSGLGDLVLSCSSAQSRNFSFGLALGSGEMPEPAREGAKLAEGAFTAAALVAMAQERGVDMPIAQAVAAVLDRTLTIDDAIESLMTRPFRAEA